MTLKTSEYRSITKIPSYKEALSFPPRLSASTIERLFTNNGYDLRKVRETKLVNVGNQVPQLPTELKNIQSVKKKKSYLSKLFYL